jgi:microsomal dipeptidase-like Zn-dependent dipeptidase
MNQHTKTCPAIKGTLFIKGILLLTALALLALSAMGAPPATGPTKIDPTLLKDPAQFVFKGGVKGFADLHCHPAAHLAFGADAAGGGRLFAGRPGMSITGSTLADDLHDCSTEHFWDDADPVRSTTRSKIRDGMDAGQPHGRGGWPDLGGPELKGWPHARSVMHQQMHTTWIYRAYQGGLRIMVASLSDNQTLSMLWNRAQFAPRPSFNPSHDFESAKRQAGFLEEWAAANASWAQIVTSPAEAREAINKGKLAIILSTEMDTLSTDQILTLVHDYKVRMVMPIHFANNQFGGPAAYGDMFNTNNHYLTGSFYSVIPDTNLAFHLGDATYLRYMDHTEPDSPESLIFGILTAGTIGIGAMSPTVDTSLVYPTTGGGHRNSRAFNTVELRRLLKEGLIVDVAHMSQISQEAALAATKSGDWEYPVLDSHTGFRNSLAENERAMRTSDASVMASRGGVVGIGTVGDNQAALILDANPPRGGGNNVARLTGDSREWLTARRPILGGGYRFRFVRVTLTTGKDDKRDHEAAFAVIKTGATRQEFDLVPERSGLGGGTTITKVFPLATPITLGDITLVGVRHETGDYFQDGARRDPDNWDIKAVKMELLPDPVTAWAQDAARMLSTMGDRGIALGTDFNGLEKQMPGLPTINITYPINIVARFAPTMRLSDRSVPPALNRHVTGGKTFDFRNDGLAHFGMLPDFLQAVSQTPEGDKVVNKLFDGAEDVIRLWEKAQVAKTRVP